MSDSPGNLSQQVAHKIRSYSEKTRMSHVSAWRASGMNLSQYSKAQGISVSALSKWIKYYGDRLLNESFKEVSLKPSPSYQYSKESPMIEIKMPNGVQLKLPLDSKSFNLAQLLGVLSQCS